MTSSRVRRGDIWWVDFEPAVGGEVRKVRPAVVLSNDTACLAQNRVQVIPITSAIARIRSWEAAIEVDGRACKAMADQIKTVAKERMRDRVGRASDEEIKQVERAVRIQLGLTSEPLR